MEPWQDVVAQYDRKAYRKNGLILLTFTGSFRAMNSKIPAERLIQFEVIGSHLETLTMAEATLHGLRSSAQSLEERIELRKDQRPYQQKYLYHDE